MSDEQVNMLPARGVNIHEIIGDLSEPIRERLLPTLLREVYQLLEDKNLEHLGYLENTLKVLPQVEQRKIADQIWQISIDSGLHEYEDMRLCWNLLSWLGTYLDGDTLYRAVEIILQSRFASEDKIWWLDVVLSHFRAKQSVIQSVLHLCEQLPENIFGELPNLILIAKSRRDRVIKILFEKLTVDSKNRELWWIWQEIAPHLTETELHQAVEPIRKISETAYRAPGLLAIARCTTGTLRGLLLQEVIGLDLFQHIGDYWFSTNFIEIVKLMNADQIDHFLASAANFSQDRFLTLLSIVAEYLPRQTFEQYREMLEQIEDDENRLSLLSAAIQHLPVGRAEQVLEQLRLRSEDSYGFMSAVVSYLPLFNENKRQQWVQFALDEIHNLPSGGNFMDRSFGANVVPAKDLPALFLLKLIPFADQTQQTSMIRRLLDDTSVRLSAGIVDERVIEGLLPYLNEMERARLAGLLMRTGNANRRLLRHFQPLSPDNKRILWTYFLERIEYRSSSQIGSFLRGALDVELIDALGLPTESAEQIADSVIEIGIEWRWI